MSDSLRILIVEDDYFARESIRRFLQNKGMTVLDADSAESALVYIEDPHTTIDVALVDIELPWQSGEVPKFGTHVGIQVARIAREQAPELGIIFISGHFEYGPEVLQLSREGEGCIAYLLKGAPPDELLHSIQKVKRRRAALEIAYGVETRKITLLDRVLSILPADEQSRVLRALELIHTLSDAELRVFNLLGYGYSTQHISELLNVSRRAIESHRGSIYEKLYLREQTDPFNQLALVTTIGLLYQLSKQE